MPMFVSRQFFLPFVKQEKVAHNVWTFYFYRIGQSVSGFFPGQYNNVTLPVKDKNGNNRDFTISSSPTEKDYLTITTKMENKPSNFKSAFFHLVPGTKVEF